MDTKNKKTKVIVAMSGGVDSSVAAALLKKQGYDVVGIFMKFWAPAGVTQINTDLKTDLHRYENENRCCSPESEKRARQVAKILNIPLYVLNFKKEFKKRVVDYFLKKQKAGRTPNPCVVCNKEIKFGLLLEKALKLGADYVATGHYARIKREIRNSKSKILNKSKIPIYKLLRAKDKNKDQSYFLWQLSQKQFSRVLFPIGDYTRKEVEEMAKKFKLPFSGVKKSFEVCFIQTTVNDFLRKYIKNKPGKIVDKQENIIGEHDGLWFYTIGQRKGIEIPQGPYFVSDKNLKKNQLIVTKDEKKLYKKELIAKNVNWISEKELKFPLKIEAKIRYRSQSSLATINKTLNPKTYTLNFDRPQRAITPGQSVVFYKGEELIGGGIIQ